jgi:hypothetical protein
VPEISLRTEFTSDLLGGVNCDGNFGCERGYCLPNIISMKNIVGQIGECMRELISLSVAWLRQVSHYS